jgi:rod shape-determining protein MreC
MLSFIVNISNLKRQNNDLSSKIISLEVDRSRIAELENENKLLKNELGFAEKNKDYNLMPATIVGREPTSFLDYVIVDKGEQDGTKKGMGVISGGVLVGQISEVYANQSKITLITSKDSLILAMLQNSRAKGILRGGIAGLSLEDIAQDVNFDPKEYVVTSGLDGQLKPGILIGTANGIQSSSSDLFKNISVEPITDLSNLELVFIIK